MRSSCCAVQAGVMHVLLAAAAIIECFAQRCCPQVVNVAPEAGGAGVAEVTAYLNGCFMPKVGAALPCQAVACCTRQHTSRLAHRTAVCVWHACMLCRASRALQARDAGKVWQTVAHHPPPHSADPEHPHVYCQVPVGSHSSGVGTAGGAGGAYDPHGAVMGLWVLIVICMLFIGAMCVRRCNGYGYVFQVCMCVRCHALEAAWTGSHPAAAAMLPRPLQSAAHLPCVPNFWQPPLSAAALLLLPPHCQLPGCCCRWPLPFNCRARLWVQGSARGTAQRWASTAACSDGSRLVVLLPLPLRLSRCCKLGGALARALCLPALLALLLQASTAC